MEPIPAVIVLEARVHQRKVTSLSQGQKKYMKFD